MLVVDDNRDAADTLADMLQLMGHRVAVAYDGLEALRLAPALDPHLVVLDIGLPGIDGYEVARRLRRERPRTLLVALTGYGTARDREQSREAGFDEHLVKPLAAEQLRAALARAAPRQRLADEPSP